MRSSASDRWIVLERANQLRNAFSRRAAPRCCSASSRVLSASLKKKKVGERRSTIFRGYSRVLCNRRPMHLAGQSFMAEARTRKNVCFNFGARLSAAAPCLPRITAPPVSILSQPVAALNYSECEKIRKIRSSALPSVPVSFSILSRRKSWPKRCEADFSSVTASIPPTD